MENQGIKFTPTRKICRNSLR